jgi:hypothetical protein
MFFITYNKSEDEDAIRAMRNDILLHLVTSLELTLAAIRHLLRAISGSFACASTYWSGIGASVGFHLAAQHDSEALAPAAALVLHPYCCV